MENDIRGIKLTNVNEVTILDPDDYEQLKKYKWSKAVSKKINNDGYVQARVSGNTQLMHRVIMKAQKGQEVDHINRNKLDNRKENLRFCTHSENCLNTDRHYQKRKTSSKYLGVYWNKASHKWRAKIVHAKRQYYLGSFKDEIEAARAYDRKSVELRGSDAKRNFPDEDRL